MDKLYTLVKEQFPEFVQADYPKFVEFIQAYYKWLEEYLPVNLKLIVDIDNAPAEYLAQFIKQLDVYGLFTDADPYVLRYIKNIKEVYASKGGEQGLLFLLNAVHGVEATISYPIDNVLRASDGKWFQESFITLSTVFGDFESIEEWDFSYDCRCVGRGQIIPVTRTHIIGDDLIRLYYQARSSIITFIGQKINVYNSSGVLLYAGEIIASPASISVLRPGRDWQLGQIITWPNLPNNTIARVAEVDSEGGIKRVEVIEYGENHVNGETFTLSPYPVKPLGSSVDLVSEQISAAPLAYHHTLTIDDYTDGTAEDVQGFASGAFFGSYFLENYASSDYNGVVVFRIESGDAPTEQGNTSLTIEQWLASRATLFYNFSPTSKLRGRWLDDAGQISNQNIRLQDNFYYQQFSYVIDSQTAPSTYLELSNSIHPAGMKQFTTYTLTQDLNLTVFIEANTQWPYVKLDLLDVANVTESSMKDTTKERFDAVDPTDDITNKTVVKARIDSVDSTESINNNLNKYLTDTATADSSEEYSIELDVPSGRYAEATMFAEQYTGVENILTLGA